MQTRILLVTDEVPYPLGRSGGHQRIELLRRALSRVGEVDVVCLNIRGETRGTNRDPLQHPDLRVIAVFGPMDSEIAGPRWPSWVPAPVQLLHSALARLQSRYAPRPAIADGVRALINDGGYSVVVARHPRIAAHIGLHRVTGVRTALDMDDVPWLQRRSEVREPSSGTWRTRVAKRWMNALFERQERAVVSKMNHLWVASRHDQEAVRPLRATVLPNIPFDEPPPVAVLRDPLDAPPQSEIILFVGELSWGPNRHGLSRFIQRVWPMIRALRPNARLRVVGGGLSDSLKSDFGRVPGVELAGFVKHLPSEYADAAFAVVPVYYGGGTKIKVLETFGFLRTCVVAPHVHDGYAESFSDGREYFVGHTDRGFAEACVTLLGDHTRRAAMATAGRSVVDAKFTRQTFDRAVEQELGSV